MYKVTVFFYDFLPLITCIELDLESLKELTEEWKLNNPDILGILIEDC